LDSKLKIYLLWHSKVGEYGIAIWRKNTPVNIILIG